MAFRCLVFFFCLGVQQYSITMELDRMDIQPHDVAADTKAACALLQLGAQPVEFNSYFCKICKNEIKFHPSKLHEQQVEHIFKKHADRVYRYQYQLWAFCFEGTVTFCVKCNQGVGISSLLTDRNKHWSKETTFCLHPGCSTHNEKKIAVSTFSSGHHLNKHETIAKACETCREQLKNLKLQFTKICYPNLPARIIEDLQKKSSPKKKVIQ